jgi:hypothetical protein
LLYRRSRHPGGISDGELSTGLACPEIGDTIDNSQAIATHESPKTTKLYDRTADQITLDGVERVAI